MSDLGSVVSSSNPALNVLGLVNLHVVKTWHSCIANSISNDVPPTTLVLEFCVLNLTFGQLLALATLHLTFWPSKPACS